jgi:hypothetical protein
MDSSSDRLCYFSGLADALEVLYISVFWFAPNLSGARPTLLNPTDSLRGLSSISFANQVSIDCNTTAMASHLVIPDASRPSVLRSSFNNSSVGSINLRPQMLSLMLHPGFISLGTLSTSEPPTGTNLVPPPPNTSVVRSGLSTPIGP